MIELDVGNVLLKPSQRRQMMARLRRCSKMGSRLGGFLLRINVWRTGRQYELRAAVRDRAGDFLCRVRRTDWAEAVRDLIRALSARLHHQCLVRGAA
jgi:hypothetical protein